MAMKHSKAFLAGIQERISDISNTCPLYRYGELIAQNKTEFKIEWVYNKTELFKILAQHKTKSNGLDW